MGVASLTGDPEGDMAPITNYVWKVDGATVANPARRRNDLHAKSKLTVASTLTLEATYTDGEGNVETVSPSASAITLRFLVRRP